MFAVWYAFAGGMMLASIWRALRESGADRQGDLATAGLMAMMILIMVCGLLLVRSVERGNEPQMRRFIELALGRPAAEWVAE